MAEIRFAIDRERDLTTVTIIGNLQAHEFRAILEDFYKQSPTRLMMMDSRQGSWSSMATTDYRRSIQTWITLGSACESGRAAIIFSDPADFGMGRYLESHLHMAGYPAEIECFRDINRAESWLFATA